MWRAAVQVRKEKERLAELVLFRASPRLHFRRLHLVNSIIHSIPSSTFSHFQPLDDHQRSTATCPVYLLLVVCTLPLYLYQKIGDSSSSL